MSTLCMHTLQCARIATAIAIKLSSSILADVAVLELSTSDAMFECEYS
jgi:hypothetical protein